VYVSLLWHFLRSTKWRGHRLLPPSSWWASPVRRYQRFKISSSPCCYIWEGERRIAWVATFSSSIPRNLLHFQFLPVIGFRCSVLHLNLRTERRRRQIWGMAIPMAPLHCLFTASSSASVRVRQPFWSIRFFGYIIRITVELLMPFTAKHTHTHTTGNGLGGEWMGKERLLLN
jgi:hypothetical protein